MCNNREAEFGQAVPYGVSISTNWLRLGNGYCASRVGKIDTMGILVEKTETGYRET